MSEEVTMEKLKPLLDNISNQIAQTNTNVISIQTALEEARRDISDTIRENAVMTEKVNNLKESNESKHKEIDKSLSLNWEKTRKIETKLVWYSGGLAALLAIATFFKSFI